MPEYGRALGGMCRHCAKIGTVRIGECPVCHEAVCDQCGDIYHARGEKHAIHHECRAHEKTPFRMIKFVE